MTNRSRNLDNYASQSVERGPYLGVSPE